MGGGCPHGRPPCGNPWETVVETFAFAGAALLYPETGTGFFLRSMFLTLLSFNPRCRHNFPLSRVFIKRLGYWDELLSTSDNNFASDDADRSSRRAGCVFVLTRSAVTNTQRWADQSEVPTWNSAAFSAYVRRTREQQPNQMKKYNFWRVENLEIIPGGYEIWYGEALFYLKLVGPPGTLAGDILQMTVDIPRYDCDLEIIGNEVRGTEGKPLPDVIDYREDCSAALAKLPVIVPDLEKHVLEASILEKEIRQLLQCKGNPHVVQLLGRTQAGELVFPKYKQTLFRAALGNQDKRRVRTIKRWMTGIIDGVAVLHKMGIVHGNLNVHKIYETESHALVIGGFGSPIVGHIHQAPELDDNREKITFASDIFALGVLLWHLCFYNNAVNRAVILATPTPPPFLDIFLACTREKPEARPTIKELRAMIDEV
jgi:hypothetical protein